MENQICSEGQNWIAARIDDGVEQLDLLYSKSWVRQNWFVSRSTDGQGRRHHIMAQNGIVMRHYASRFSGNKIITEPIDNLIDITGFGVTWRALRAMGYAYATCTYLNTLTGETISKAEYEHRFGGWA